MQFDGMGFKIEWRDKSCVKPVDFDWNLKNPEYKKSWWFYIHYGVRSRNCTEEQKKNGALADYCNPFFHIMILGLFIGVGFSFSWGVDNIKANG